MTSLRRQGFRRSFYDTLLACRKGGGGKQREQQWDRTQEALHVRATEVCDLVNGLATRLQRLATWVEGCRGGFAAGRARLTWVEIARDCQGPEDRQSSSPCRPARTKILPGAIRASALAGRAERTCRSLTNRCRVELWRPEVRASLEAGPATGFAEEREGVAGPVAQRPHACRAGFGGP